MPSPDFSNKVFRPWIVDAMFTDEQSNTILKALSKVQYAYNSISADEDSKEAKRVIRKLKSRLHFVSMVYLGILHPDMDADEFTTKIWNFFNCSTTSTSNEYNATVGSGSAHPEAVQRRKAVIEAMA